MQFRSLLKAVLGVFGLKILFLALGFLGTIWLTRTFDAEQVGWYFWLLSVVSVLTVIARRGQENKLLKDIPRLNIGSEACGLENKSVYFYRALMLTLPLCIGLLVILSCVGSWLPSFSPYQTFLILCLVLIVPANLFLTLCAFTLQAELYSKRQLLLTSLPRVLVFPLLACLLLIDSDVDLYSLLNLAAISFYITALLGGYLIHQVGYRFTRTQINTISTIQTSQTGYFYWVSLSAVVMAEGTVVLLGLLSTAEQTAQFAIATRLVTITSFILVAFNTVLSPHFSRFNDDSNKNELIYLFQQARRVAGICSLIIVFFIYIFAEPILSIFGSVFSSAAITLKVLLIAHLYKVLVGSVGQLLMMTGFVRYQRRALWFAVSTLIGCCVILIPLYGALGAAVATLVAVVINNSLGLWYAHRLIGVPLGLAKHKIEVNING